jgi:hypothetical protein
MEPIAAIALATNIIQLVDVARSITSIKKDLRRSAFGFAAETAEFQNLAKLVHANVDNLLIAENARDRPDNDLKEYIKVLHVHLDEFAVQLDGLRVKTANNVWQTGKIAYKVWRTRDRMNERISIIHQMSNHISNHLATSYLPEMHLKLDDLLLQNSDRVAIVR